MGVSVENQTYAWRIEHLQRVPAAVRFLSCEPLIGPVGLSPYFNDMDFKDAHIHWVIVGGESGPKARYINPEWVRSIQHECEEFAVPFFFKQWGGKNKKRNGRLLNGRTYDEMPV
jgi:protein gp37